MCLAERTVPGRWAANYPIRPPISTLNRKGSSVKPTRSGNAERSHECRGERLRHRIQATSAILAKLHSVRLLGPLVGADQSTSYQVGTRRVS